MARNRARPPSKPSNTTDKSLKPLPSTLTGPPPAVEALLPHLSPRHIYLLHTDTFPAQHKKNVFLVPLALNTLLVLILLWRAYTGLPVYASYLETLFAPSTPGDGTPGSAAGVNTTTIAEMLRRAVTLGLDYALFAWVGVWPAGFFLGVGGMDRGAEEGERGPGSPFLNRLFHARGFWDNEIVVRRSRRSWDTVLSAGDVGLSAAEDDPRTARGSFAPLERRTPAQILASEDPEFLDGKIARSKVSDATDEAYVCARSGMGMIGRDWEVDFEAMGIVEDMIHAATTSTTAKGPEESRSQLCRELDRWCLVYHDFPSETAEVPASTNGHTGTKTTTTTADPSVSASGWYVYTPGWTRNTSDSEDQRRRLKIQAMKDRLTALGKESLFFRWVELVADAQVAPGPGSPDGAPQSPEVTAQRAKEMFEREGVDFD
ncbi:MAG: hypothetical protein M4579_000579, partial [Chaenotheca gracillima]